VYAQLWSLRDELEELKRGQQQLLRAVEVLQDREPELRGVLRELRRSPDYERAFAEAEPLVSVTIPTWNNVDALLEVAIPSVRAQTYENLEIVVVGDAAPDTVERGLRGVGDKRIRYFNLPYRGPYPSERRRRWFVAGIPPINESARLAGGSWIAPLNDDDAFTPQHIERLLAATRATHSEVAYGRFEMFEPDGHYRVAGAYPPELGEFTWQAAVYHAGLRFFEMELGDAWFDRPGDWSLCRRMLLAGVRMTMIEDVVARLYPSGTARPDRADAP
jgi:glycosyltransferase involved in cell wall biosynthesis